MPPQRSIEVTWQTDGADAELPKVVLVPAVLDDEEIADWLSDGYGWLVESWCDAPEADAASTHALTRTAREAAPDAG